MRADAAVVAERATEGGGTRLTRVRSAPPLGVRAAAGSVWLVGTAAGPLAGDRVRLRVEVGAGASLTVRSTAAMVVLGGPAPEGSELSIDVDVGPGAELRWLPEPTVATGRCRHRTSARVRLAVGATLVWREELVTGRHGEGPGRFTSRLDVESEGGPVFRQEVAVGQGAPGWAGPAVLGGAKASGTLVVIGAGLSGGLLDEQAAVMPLAAGGAVVSAVAADAATLRRVLDERLALIRSGSLSGGGREGAEVGEDDRGPKPW